MVRKASEDASRVRSKELLARALELPVAEREAFLSRECRDDDELRRLVDALLDAHGKAGGFLGGEHAFDEDRPGATIDRYRLVERIGEGGFGTVWAAEQVDPVRRTIALKILKPGMDSRSVVARFGAERQALALLDHPGIAKVLDGGATPSGRPYFVMELVHGEPITDYCDRNALSVDARLTLFVRVCAAVQHAHHKGIVHRDLKPSNVLVATADGGPAPKVIDFGIAKAMEGDLLEEGIVTEAGGILGTPAYMAPEQAAGERLDVDSRADVYSLGCLLHELLAGRRPFEALDTTRAGVEALLRRIREDDPSPPSTCASAAGEEGHAIAGARGTTLVGLVRRLRGELDWIVARALEKDRERRYATAAALADDVERHLSGEPVAAVAPSAGYRLRKLVRRHRVGFLAGSAVAAALVAGLALALMGLGRARRALDVASEAEERALEELATSEAVATFLNEDLLRSASPKELGRDVTVREALDTAAQRLEGRFADRPLVEAAVRTTLGNTYLDLGRHAEGVRELQRARELVLAAGATERPLAFKNLAALGDAAFEDGDGDEALRLYREALAGRTAVLGPEHSDTLVTRANLGGMLALLGRGAEAEPLLAEAVRSLRRIHGEHHLRTLSAMSNHSLALRLVGREDEALALSEHLFEVSREHRGEDDNHTLTALHNLGTALANAGRTEEGLPLLAQVVEGKERTLGRNHAETLVMTISFAAACMETGRLAEARSALEDVSERLESGAAVLSEEQMGSVHDRWGDLLRREGRLEEAEEAYALAYDVFSVALGPEARKTVRALADLANVLRLRGVFDESERLFARALETDREGGRPPFDWRLLRAECLTELGRFEEAEAELVRGAELAADETGPSASDRVLERFERLYAAWGRPEELEFWRGELRSQR